MTATEDQMAEHDARDFLAAFAIGAALGVGAALLLRPEPPSRTQRLLRDLDPYRKRLRKSVRRASRRLTGRTDLKGEVLSLGRDFLRDLRAEADAIVAQAREELARAVEDEVARAGARRERRPARA